MTPPVAAGLALAAACALGTNLGWLIKHRGAQASPRMRHRHPWQSLRALLSSRLFVIGFVIATAAGVLHIFALALAPISIVQVVLAAGLVTLAALAGPVCGARVTPRQQAGLLLSAAGLAILAFTLPVIGGAHSSAPSASLTTFAIVVSAAGGALLLAPRIRRLARHDGALIGAASGVFFGVADLAVKALLGLVSHGLVALVLSPWLLVALTAGLVAQYVSARSLQTGDPISVTAMTALAVNVINISGGILVFGDPLATGLPATIAELVAFGLICSATFLTPAPVEPRRRRSGASVAT